MQTGCNGFKLYLALNVTFLAFYSSRHNSCLLLLITVDLDCASAFFLGGRGGWGRGKGVALKLPKCFFYQLHYDKFITGIVVLLYSKHFPYSVPLNVTYLRQEARGCNSTDTCYHRRIELDASLHIGFLWESVFRLHISRIAE